MQLTKIDDKTLTVETLAKNFPTSHRGLITQELVDKLNKVSNDMDEAEHIRENFISFAKIIKEGKYSIDEYFNAVKFVSLKVMGYTDRDSYIKTFPLRHAKMMANNYDDRRQSAMIHAFAKSKLVNLIYEQTYIPVWILNRDIHQEAINATAELMRSAKSEKVRCDAANNLLNHLKRPEATQIDLNMNVKDSSGIAELKEALAQMAQAQISMIQAGASTKSVAQQKLVISSGSKDINDIEEIIIED